MGEVKQIEDTMEYPGETLDSVGATLLEGLSNPSPFPCEADLVISGFC